MTRAFTLIETIITVAITLALAAALAAVFYAFNSFSLYQRDYRASTESVSRVTRAVERAVLPARAVLASHAFTSGTYNSSTTTLVVELPSIDGSGVVLDGHFDYAAFYAEGQTAFELTEADAASARQTASTTLGTNVVSLAFSYDNADVTAATTVTVDVSASSTVKGMPAASRATERIRLRNR